MQISNEGGSEDELSETDSETGTGIEEGDSSHEHAIVDQFATDENEGITGETDFSEDNSFVCWLCYRDD